jgi:hypothetical protein
MDDELVYRNAETLRDRDLFYAQDVADAMLESDVGGVLASLRRLADQHRLVEVVPEPTSDPADDATEYERFRFPSDAGDRD